MRTLRDAESNLIAQCIDTLLRQLVLEYSCVLKGVDEALVDTCIPKFYNIFTFLTLYFAVLTFTVFVICQPTTLTIYIFRSNFGT